MNDRAAAAFLLVLASLLASCTAFKTAPAGGVDDASGVDGARISDAQRDAMPRDATSTREGSREDASADAGRACAGGACGVIVMVSHLVEPVAVAVDATYLYWLEGGVLGDAGAGGYGELARVPKSKPCSGPTCVFTVLDPNVLAGNGIYNSTMGLGPTDVCYTQTFDATFQYSINCVSLGDGSEQNLAQGTGYVQGIWVGPAGALWAVAGSMTGVADGVVLGEAFGGGAMHTIASGRPSPWGITGDGTQAYWTELGLDAGQGSVLAAPATADGGTQSLAVAQASPQAVVVHAGYAYWADEGAGTIQRVKLAGGPPELVAANQPSPFALAVDSSGTYWANLGKPFQNDYEGGSVAHVGAPGGPVTVDLPNLTNLFGLALDGGHVYAVVGGTYANNYADGEIDRVAR